MQLVRWIVLLMLLGAGANRERVVEDRCDLIELNYTQREPEFAGYWQVIFWDYSPDYRRHDVVAWTMLPYEIEHRGGECLVSWYDPEVQCRRVVRARLYRETQTRLDPEREHQRLMPYALRRGFSK
jgi:hypothetical protein